MLELVSREVDEGVSEEEEALVSEARVCLGDVLMVDWRVAVAQAAEEHVSSHERIRMPEKLARDDECDQRWW